MLIFFGKTQDRRSITVRRIRDVLAGSFGSGGFADNIRHLILVSLYAITDKE